MWLVPRVCGGVSSHIGCSAPPVPGWSFGRYGVLPLPVTSRGGQGTRVPCWAGRGGPDGAASRVHGVVFLVSASGGLGPWGDSHTLHEGGAEGTEDLLHKGCVRFLGFRLTADDGLQLPAHRQRPDLVDRANSAHVRRSGGLRRPLALGDGLPLLPAVQVEPPRRRPVPGVQPAALSPPPEAVEGMARVPAAGFPQHNGRQGVSGLVMGQGGGAVRQGCSRLEHAVHSFQVPVALLRVRGDPHLVAVATFQRDHGDGAGVILRSRGSCACRLRHWWVRLHQFSEVAPPVGGRPAFPFRQAFVRWDVEGVSCRLWGGPFPAPGAWRGPGVRRWRYERVCPAQVRDPYASLVWLVGDEPPDPRVDKVVCDLHPRADECLELPHVDVCGCQDVACGRGTTAKSLFGWTSWRLPYRRSLPGPAPAVPLPPVTPADLLRINDCISQNPQSPGSKIQKYRKCNPPSTLNSN